MTAFSLVEDNNALVRANYLRNMHGLDKMSTGHMIGYAMLCYERGQIIRADTDGIGSLGETQRRHDRRDR